ncbi:hypothetical protein G6F37_012418 [Rhizopus arrhizus]|nr:hypothetical protein G6F37_012418 [Rhizopus arrhizus]
MDYISYIPPSDYYIIDYESKEQMEDVAYQYGDIEKIIDFDAVTETTKVNIGMEIDTITENLKIISIDDGKRKYKKYIIEQVRQFIQIMQDEGTIISKAAVRCNIPRL